jgi:fructose-bisphosphate aldolase class II
MFDGSAGDEKENLLATREIVKIAHSFGASVEGEIGHVGNADVGDGETDDMYTSPEEAMNFVKATGVDALAVAIGTAHGAYKTKPQLDINRLANIHAAIDTPLVLHGGSGLSDDDFRNTIANGIAKVNIFTDLCVAGYDSVKSFEGSYLEMRNAKVKAMKEAVINKMILFGCAGKA